MQAKTCSVCGQEKTLDSFTPQIRGKFGRTARCKTCLSAASRKWQRDNPEKTAAKMKEWRRKNQDRVNLERRNAAPEQKAIEALRVRAWRERNPGAAYAVTKSYRAKRPGYASSVNRKRALAQLRATPKWLTPAQIAEIEGVYLYGALFGFHIDHIVPIKGKTVCGLHVPWNLQPLTPSENIAKGNRLCGGDVPL